MCGNARSKYERRGWGREGRGCDMCICGFVLDSYFDARLDIMCEMMNRCEWIFVEGWR